jgi:hypothetical protein
MPSPFIKYHTFQNASSGINKMATFDFEKNWNELYDGLQLLIDICLNIELNRKLDKTQWMTIYKYFL